MAAGAFVLAPSRPLNPETDREWAQRYAAWWEHAYLTWDALRGRLSDEDRRLARGCFGSPSLSGNSTDAMKYREDEGLVRAARAWVEDGYAAWVAAGRAETPPDCTPADFERSTGERSDIGIDSLIDYRGGYKAIPTRKLPAGAAAAWVGNKAALDEFSSWTSRQDHELRVMLTELTRVHGGQSLALWTYGHAVHAWHARSAEPGKPPVVTVVSHRIARRAGRAPSRLRELRDAMSGGALAPDWDALEAQLAADRLSVRAWFEAFGVAGAEELSTPDLEEAWERFERVATALLRAQPAEAGDVKALNEVIEPLDAEARLKPKPLAKRGGRQARAIANAAGVLGEAIGHSRSGRWRERWRAARTWWDIGEGPAGERLVTLSERARRRGASTRMGQAADLGRLLGHYPLALARDPIFLALAALEAEAANGHGFVEGLLVLSEIADTAGFTLAVYPARTGEDFCATFGIARVGDSGGDSEAQAFIDLPGVTDGLRPALAAWYERTKSDGVVLRAEADGRWTATNWAAGEAVTADRPIDGVALEESARSLTPRRALSGLGLPDLLEPGEWEEGSYAGEGRQATTIAPYRLRAEQAIAALPADTTTVSDVRGLRDLVGDFIRGDQAGDRIAALRLEPSTGDEDLVEELRVDLGGRGLANAGGATWIVGDAVFALSWRGLDTSLLVNVIADLQLPLRLAVDSKDYAGRIVVGR